MSEPYGVHSEVGTLRKVLVCSPGRAHERLTPSNCDSLLFDDVLWVQNGKRDHFDFITKMRERGVEVVEMHNLLAETLENPTAKAWLLDRQITANEVGLGLVEDTRAYLESLDSRALAATMLGGLSANELPDKYARNISRWCARRPASRNICCRRCRTPSTRAIPPAGSTAASP